MDIRFSGKLLAERKMTPRASSSPDSAATRSAGGVLVRLQDRVDPGLVARPLGLEPVENLGVETERNGGFPLWRRQLAPGDFANDFGEVFGRRFGRFGCHAGCRYGLGLAVVPAEPGEESALHVVSCR